MFANTALLFKAAKMVELMPDTSKKSWSMAAVFKVPAGPLEANVADYFNSRWKMLAAFQVSNPIEDADIKGTCSPQVIECRREAAYRVESECLERVQRIFCGILQLALVLRNRIQVSSSMIRPQSIFSVAQYDGRLTSCRRS